MITVSTKALGTWFGMPGTTMEEGSPLDRNFLIVLMCIAIGMLIKRKFSPGDSIRENRWLTVLVVFMLISIVWSPVPFVSIKRWIREIIAIVMGFLVLTETSPKKAIEAVIRRTVYLLIPLSLVLIKYFPQYGVDYTRWTGDRMWIGVTDQKNDFGQLTSLAVFFLVWAVQRQWKVPRSQRIRYVIYADLGVLAIALYLSKGGEAGYSATALVMLAVAMMCYAGLLWLKKKNKILSPAVVKTYIVFLVIYGTLTPLMGRLPIGDITSSLGRSSTLTDRTDIWNALIPYAASKPILGHGVGGFWTSDRLDRLSFPAHNGFLEVVLVLGFVGLALMAIFLASSAGKAQNLFSRDYDWGVLWICWLTMALLNNITESSLNSFSNFLMAVPIWLAVTYKSSD